MSELLDYVSDPENAEYNFALGCWYDAQGHTAAAVGFYVRTAEYAFDDLLVYEALLRTANCMVRQGDQVYITKGVLLRAVSLMPQRPEAYFLLSQLYERHKDWQESYSFAVLGQRVSAYPHSKLRTDVEYPGQYGLLFEQAVSAWWIGLFDESILLFRHLKKGSPMLPIFAAAVEQNLQTLPLLRGKKGTRRT